jgi:hypothetical protein
MTDTSEEPLPSGQDSAPDKPPEPEPPKPPTTPLPQVPAPAQRQRIWRGITIISLILSVGATFGVTARELFLVEPILEHPPVSEVDTFSQPFWIRNGMSFFTMHDTCALTFIESQIYNNQANFLASNISEKLNDIGPGKVNYLETTPGSAFHGSRPSYGSFRFFVRYYTNLLGFHWTRDFDLGTCQWKLETRVMWECRESANVREIRLPAPLLKYDPASGKLAVQNKWPIDDQVVRNELLECR